MKTTTLILIWINRIIMTPFLITLLLSLFDNGFFIYPMYIAFVLGIYQLATFLITLFVIYKVRTGKLTEVITYITVVILYFLIGYFVIDNFSKSDYRILIQIFLISVPILLSIFWTYILESIKTEL